MIMAMAIVIIIIIIIIIIAILPGPGSGGLEIAHNSGIGLWLRWAEKWYGFLGAPKPKLGPPSL